MQIVNKVDSKNILNINDIKKANLSNKNEYTRLNNYNLDKNNKNIEDFVLFGNKGDHILELNKISNININGELIESYCEDFLKKTIKLKNGAIIEIDNMNNKKYIDQNGNEYLFDSEGDIIDCSNDEMGNIYNKIFNEDRKFGGSQNVFKDDVVELLENEEIRKILEVNFPDATEEDYQLYLNKLCNVGCGYTAMANSIFEQFYGKEKEFKEVFGISMYRIDQNGNVIFNYEPLILDIFTYFWHDVQENDDITTLYQNADSEVKKRFYNGEKINVAIGSTELTYFSLLSFFYDNCNSSGYNTEYDYQKDKNWLLNNLDEIKANEESIIINAVGCDLYRVDSITGERGKLELEDIPAHAMSFVDVTENGDLIVSSWGQEWIIDISDPNCSCDYTIYDINYQLDSEM